jgi:hypothetical protein
MKESITKALKINKAYIQELKKKARDIDAERMRVATEIDQIKKNGDGTSSVNLKALVKYYEVLNEQYREAYSTSIRTEEIFIDLMREEAIKDLEKREKIVERNVRRCVEVCFDLVRKSDAGDFYEDMYDADNARAAIAVRVGMALPSALKTVINHAIADITGDDYSKVYQVKARTREKSLKATYPSKRFKSYKGYLQELRKLNLDDNVVGVFGRVYKNRKPNYISSKKQGDLL